nr:hypothetical protein CFP56_24625 [Quercus suber]
MAESSTVINPEDVLNLSRPSYSSPQYSILRNPETYLGFGLQRVFTVRFCECLHDRAPVLCCSFQQQRPHLIIHQECLDALRMGLELTSHRSYRFCLRAIQAASCHVVSTSFSLYLVGHEPAHLAVKSSFLGLRSSGRLSGEEPASEETETSQ